MGERMGTKNDNDFSERLKAAWGRGYDDGFHGRPLDMEFMIRSKEKPLLEKVYVNGYEEGRNVVENRVEWTDGGSERPELSPEEFFDLLNGKIAGLVLSINMIMDKSMEESSLFQVKNSLHDAGEFIKSEKEKGLYSHMPKEYINGTLHVLEKLAKLGKGK